MGLWHSKISFHHHPEPVVFETKDGQSNLLEFTRSTTPPCQLNPFLFNGHLQTFWTAVNSLDIPIFYKRKIFEAEDPTYAGSFAVDFVVEPYNDVDRALPPRTTFFNDAESEAMASSDHKPMLIILHGLSGGSHEIYLRETIRPVVEAGWEACVVNSRGCAMSKVTTGVLYNARATWDLRQMVKWLRKTFPNRKLYGLAFSLGANMMVNYLGEEGEESLIDGAVVVSNPWNCEVSSLALQRSWLGLEVYSRIMGSSMKALFEEHVDAISKNSRVDIAKVRSIRYLHEFDRELQGPTWGYPTEGAYYRDASSVDSLLAVKVPLLAIHAEDDPIAVKEALPFEEVKQNPYTILCTTSSGGHLSWFELGGGRWFAKPASQFLIKMAEEVSAIKSKQAPHKDGTSRGPTKDGSCHVFEPMRRKLYVQQSQ